MASKLDLTIRRGETFTRVVRWEAMPVVFKAISGITQAAPAVVTANGHGIPDGWRVAIVSVKGMTQINAESDPPTAADYHKVKVLTANTLQLEGVNTSLFKPYTSGGYLQFNTPVDLSGCTARMQIKDKVGGTVLKSLTTENGGITLDNTLKTITINISAADAAAFTWTKAVYDLEMVSTGGVVTALLEGTVKVTPEVTT